VDRLRELRHLSRGGHIVPTLGVDLSDVGVGSGFDHDDIIGTGGDALGRSVDTSAIDPEHQISDGVGVRISTTPADGFSLLRAHPDHTGFTPELSDAVGVVDRLCPPAPVLIEVVPVGGLNGEGQLRFL